MKKRKYELTAYEKLLIQQANEEFYKKYPNYGKKNIPKIKKKLTYKEYLKSKEWQKKKRKVLKRAKGICEICKLKRAWQVHHKTYKRLFHEQVEDLIAVCGTCHQDEHKLLTDEQIEIASEKLLIKSGFMI